MNKREFYKIQSEAFKDYANKFPDKKDLLAIYNEWAVSKDIHGVDRHRIWLKVRDLRRKKTIIVEEGSEEYRRIHQIVDIFHREDLLFLEKIMKKEAK